MLKVATPPPSGGRSQLGTVDLGAVLRRRLGAGLIAGVLACAAAVGGLGAREPVYRVETAIAVAPAPGSEVPWYEVAGDLRAAVFTPDAAATATETDGDRVVVWWEASTADEAERLARGGLADALPLAREWIGPDARIELDAPPAARAVERPAGLIVAAVASLGLIGAALGAALAEGAARWRRT